MNINRILARGMQVVRGRRFRAFEALCQAPLPAQEALLKGLIASHGQTAHARRLGVPTSRAADIAAFRASCSQGELWYPVDSPTPASLLRWNGLKKTSSRYGSRRA